MTHAGDDCNQYLNWNVLQARQDLRLAYFTIFPHSLQGKIIQIILSMAPKRLS
jgi:hypothetical protein